MATQVSTAAFMSQVGQNANAATNSTPFNIKGAYNVSWQVVANTGTNGTHVITLQESPDNSVWTNTASTLGGVGVVRNFQVAFHWVRLRVTTNEGGASTVDWFINAK